jgi:hypothetical protein
MPLVSPALGFAENKHKHNYFHACVTHLFSWVMLAVFTAVTPSDGLLVNKRCGIFIQSFVTT